LGALCTSVKECDSVESPHVKTTQVSIGDLKKYLESLPFDGDSVQGEYEGEEAVELLDSDYQEMEDGIISTDNQLINRVGPEEERHDIDLVGKKDVINRSVEMINDLFRGKDVVYCESIVESIRESEEQKRHEREEFKGVKKEEMEGVGDVGKREDHLTKKKLEEGNIGFEGSEEKPKKMRMRRKGKKPRERREEGGDEIVEGEGLLGESYSSMKMRDILNSLVGVDDKSRIKEKKRKPLTEKEEKEKEVSGKSRRIRKIDIQMDKEIEYQSENDESPLRGGRETISRKVSDIL
jgi:hypothetical protein